MPLRQGENHFTVLQGCTKCWGIPAVLCVYACASKMAYAAPFTQALLVGAIGLRFPNRELRFDPAAGRFTNYPEANAFLQAPARGAFSMKDFA